MISTQEQASQPCPYSPYCPYIYIGPSFIVESRVYFLQFKKIEIFKRYTLPTARRRK